MCENITDTIMDVNSKIKDGVNAETDLAEHCKCQKLYVQATKTTSEDIKTMPSAPFTLNEEPQKRKKALCEWIKNLKFPHGYALNFSR